MRNSNFSTNLTSLDILHGILVNTEHVFRYITIVVHLVFIIVLIASREIRTRNQLYVNHATVTSISYAIFVFGFMFGDTPNFSDPLLNTILCTLAGYFRDSINYLRPYSLLIIAIYRYLAVYNLNFFKRINRSNILLLTPIVLVWFLSILFPIILNQALNTYIEPMLCLIGNSDSTTISLLYFLITYTFLLFVPNIITFFLYVRIMIKLKSMKNRVNIIKSSSVPIKRVIASNEPGPMPGMNTTSHVSINYKKEKVFAKHFFLMCISVILTNIGFSIFYMSHIVPNYYEALYYWLPFQRLLSSLGISLVPITSLYFHPARDRFFNRIKTSKYFSFFFLC